MFRLKTKKIYLILSVLIALIIILLCIVINHKYSQPIHAAYFNINSTEDALYYKKNARFQFLEDDTGTFKFNLTEKNEAIIVGVTFAHRTDTSLTIPAKITQDGSEYVVAGLGYGHLVSYSGNSTYEAYIAGFCGMSNLSSITFEENPNFKYLFCLNADRESSKSFSLFEGTKIKEITLPPSTIHIGYLFQSTYSYNIDTSSISTNKSHLVNSYGIFAYSEIQKINFEPTQSCFIGPDSFYNTPLAINEPFKIINNYELTSNTFKNASLTQGVIFEDGYLKSSLPEYLFNNSGLTSIVLPDSITTLSSYTFNKCSSLTNVQFSNNLTIISANTFAGCTGLSTIDLSNTQIEVLSENAFLNCTGIQQIILPNTIKTISASAFKGCTNLSSINLPESLTSIGASAFEGCTSLQTVTLPSQLTKIEAKTFYGCTSLNSITIPTDTTLIGDSAFEGCSKLTNITFNDNLEQIGASAFKGCSILQNFTLPDSLKIIGASAFENCTTLTNITIPSQVTNISDRMFYGCSKLQSITLSDNTTIIGNSSFYNCTSLLKFDAPQELTDIGASAFYNCSALAEFNFNEKLVNIGSSAIRNCTNLQSLALPDTVETIGSYAFVGDTTLTNFAFGKSTKSIEKNAFDGCSAIVNLTIDGIDGLSLGQEMFINCSNLTNLTIKANITTIPYYFAYSIKKLETLTLPSSVKAINEGAFYGCSNLKNIYGLDNLETIGKFAFRETSKLEAFPYSTELKTIGESAFYDSGVTSITFPNTLTTINRDAFENAYNLKEIIIPSSVTTIGSEAFYSCDNLKYVKFEPNSKVTNLPSRCFQWTPLTEIILPDHLVSIADYVFCEATFETITFPDTLKTISNGAFQDNSNLKSVNIGSYSELESLSYSVFVNCSSLESFTFPLNFKTLGTSCFENCTSLSQVKFLGILTQTIPASCFKSCTSLQEINLPTSIVQINDSAFESSALAKVNFSSLQNLTTLGARAFYNTQFTEVRFPATVTSAGSEVFYKLPNLTKFTFQDNSQLITIPTKFVGDNDRYIADIQMPNCIKVLNSNCFGSANKYTFADETVLSSIGENTFMGVNYIYNFPATVPTINKLVSSINYPRTVKEIYFSENSTTTTINNSFYNIGSYIDFPESLKYMYYDVYTAYSYSWSYWDDDHYYGTYNGSILDFKNIEYIGPNTTDILKAIRSTNVPFNNCPNVSTETFNAPELKFLKGFYQMKNPINFREKAPKLKTFIGGYYCQDMDMQSWLPDEMEYVVGACQLNMTNPKTKIYLPNTTHFYFVSYNMFYDNYSGRSDTSAENRMGNLSGEFVVPNNLMDLNLIQITTSAIYNWFGSNTNNNYYDAQGLVSKLREFNLIIPEDNVTFSLENFTNLANDQNEAKQFHVYTTTQTMYNKIQAELDAMEDTDVRKIEVDVKMRNAVIDAAIKPISSGAEITSLLITDANTVNGSYFIYNTTESTVEEDLIPIAKANATTADTVITIADKDIPLGTNTYKVKFVSDSLKTLNAETEIVYSKLATPVLIDNQYEYDDVTQSLNIQSTVSTESGKTPVGTLKLYWIDPATNEAKLIKTSAVTSTSNTLNSSLSIDSEFITNGDNVYRILFVTGDPNTFNDTTTSFTVTINGTDVGLNGTVAVNQGGYIASTNILADALNYGTLTIHLGENKLGTVINSDNSLDAVIHPSKLKYGTNKITFVYETKSARYNNATVTKTFDYEPTVTDLQMSVTPSDDGSSVIVSANIINADTAQFDGILSLYLGNSVEGQFIKNTNETSITAEVSLNALNFGDNSFFAEWVPSTTTTSYASKNDIFVVKGKEVAIIGSVTNKNDTVSVIAKAISIEDNKVLPPDYFQFYFGKDNFGEPLVMYKNGDAAIADWGKGDMVKEAYNFFYVEYIPSDKTYAEAEKLLTFYMDKNGNEGIPTKPVSPEDLDKITLAIKELNTDFNIELEKLITVLNDNFELLVGDLDNISAYLQALAEKEIPDYSDKFDSLIEAIAALQTTMNNNKLDLSQIEDILTSLAEAMGDNNSNQQAILEALADLEELKNINNTLTDIKNAIDSGNINSSNISDQLTSIAEALENISANTTAIDITNIEKSLADIVKELQKQDVEGTQEILLAIKDVLATLNNSIADNKTDLSGIEDALQELINAVKAGQDIDLSGIEDILKSLVDATENNSGLDTSNIEDLLKELINTNKDISGNLNTENIEKYLEQLANNSANFSDIDKILNDISEAIKNNNLTGVETLIQKLIDSIDKNADNSKVDLSKLEDLMDKLVKASEKASDINFNGIERKLEDLISLLDEKTLHSEKMNELLEKLVETAQNSKVDLSQLESEISKISKTFKEFLEAYLKKPEIDLSGLKEALDKIASKEDQTASIVESINDLEKQIANKENVDTSNIEQSLKDLVEATANDKSVYDTSDLEKAINSFKDAYIKNNNNDDSKQTIAVLESLLKTLNSTIEQNKSELSGIRESIDDVVNKLSKLDGKTDPELLEALNSIKNILDESNKNTVDKETMEGILNALNNIDKNIKDNQLNQADAIGKIIDAILGIKLEVPEPDFSPIVDSIDNVNDKLDSISSSINKSNNITKKEVASFIVYILCAGMISFAIFSVSKKLQKIIDIMKPTDEQYNEEDYYDEEDTNSEEDNTNNSQNNVK